MAKSTHLVSSNLRFWELDF